MYNFLSFLLEFVKVKLIYSLYFYTIILLFVLGESIGHGQIRKLFNQLLFYIPTYYYNINVGRW